MCTPRSVPEAVSFDEIIRRTPAELVSAGIYRPIATPLLDEPHAAVAVRLVLNNLVITSEKDHEGLSIFENDDWRVQLFERILRGRSQQYLFKHLPCSIAYDPREGGTGH